VVASAGRAEDFTGDPIYDADRLLTRRAASLDFNLPFFKDQRVSKARPTRRLARARCSRPPDRPAG